MTYQDMAIFYDQFMDIAPYDEWVRITERILQEMKVPVKRVVDLGCGTGEITVKLAQKGYTVTGVDLSEQMLSVAAEKAARLHLPITWVNQDIRQIEGIYDQDVAISFCDVINYIHTEADLIRVFSGAASTLKDDGIFIFDVHSLYHVRENMVNQTFADVTDDSSYIWLCSEGDNPGEMYHDITFFSKQRNGSYARYDEYHHQQTFPIEVYINLLNRTGFQITRIVGDFQLENQTLPENVERIIFIAEKRSE